MSLLEQNWPWANAELAYLEPVPVTCVMNERHACVLFHGLDGRADLNRGLSGTSATFQGWCQDFFDYLGARARKALL